MIVCYFEKARCWVKYDKSFEQREKMFILLEKEQYDEIYNESCWKTKTRPTILIEDRDEFKNLKKFIVDICNNI